jgi:hypothetical protein
MFCTLAWANTPVLWYNSQLCYEAVKLAVAVDTTEPEARVPALISSFPDYIPYRRKLQKA